MVESAAPFDQAAAIRRFLAFLIVFGLCFMPGSLFSDL